MTTLYMLVGLPASGKTTWKDANRDELDAIVASSDDFIEAVAESEGKTYNEVFKTAIKGAKNHVDSLASYAFSEQIPLIWDQTNLTKNVRKTRLSRVPFGWKKICVVFECKNFEEWKRRLMNRPGKTIPVDVIEMMRTSYEEPTLDEGFDEIVRIET